MQAESVYVIAIKREVVHVVHIFAGHVCNSSIVCTGILLLEQTWFFYSYSRVCLFPVIMHCAEVMPEAFGVSTMGDAACNPNS